MLTNPQHLKLAVVQQIPLSPRILHVHRAIGLARLLFADSDDGVTVHRIEAMDFADPSPSLRTFFKIDARNDAFLDPSVSVLDFPNKRMKIKCLAVRLRVWKWPLDK